MLDVTVGTKSRVEIRGGRIKSTKVTPGKNGSWIEIGADPVIVGRSAACQMVLDDGKVSAVHAEFQANEQGVRVRDLGSRSGTFISGVRVGEVYLLTGTKLRLGETEIQFEPLRSERITVSGIPTFGRLVAHNAGMRAIFERLSKIGPTDLAVLITGEIGTGKALVAQALHDASPRAKRPFVVVDCRSIPPALAEAHLFGGASTGAADKRPSPFIEADGGTIFLDELGELPSDVQPKLLRALTERRVKSAGASTYREVDVRVLAATRRDLVRAVNTGAFRGDLYFRVAQAKIDLPALRQRAEDIPVLVRRLLKDLGDEGAFARITDATIERLTRHDWPGNVRELGNAVQIALALAAEGEELDVAAHLGVLAEPPHTTESGRSGGGGGGGGGAASGPSGSLKGQQFQEAKREILARFERDYFATLAGESKGNVSEMARRAGMERAHVRAYLRRHGIATKVEVD